jgi:hypothetical protein
LTQRWPDSPVPIETDADSLLIVGDLSWPLGRPPNLVLDPALAGTVSLVPNLEGPILVNPDEHHLRWSRWCGLWNDASIIQMLKKNNARLVGMANNHIPDYTMGGELTVRRLAAQGIGCAGYGTTARDAAAPARIVLSSGCIVLLLFAGNSRVGCTPPRRGRAGVSASNPRLLVDRVKYWRQRCPSDVLVVVAHGGDEYERLPSPDIRKLFRSLAGAGADVVVGHHPHVVQASECFGGASIAYSLGNFLMHPGPYDGVRLQRREGAEAGAGLLLGAHGVEAMNLHSNPKTGLVHQVGPPVAVDDPCLTGLPFRSDLTEESYTALYRRNKTFSWWFPVWTGNEGRPAAAVKYGWLMSLALAKVIIKRRGRNRCRP